MAVTNSFSSGIANEGNALRLPSQQTNNTKGANNFAALMVSEQNKGSFSNSGQNTAMLLAQQGLQGKIDPSQAGVHAQRLNNAQETKHQLQTLSSLGSSTGKSDSLLDVARNDVGVKNMRVVMNSVRESSSIVPMANSIKSHALSMQHIKGERKESFNENRQNLNFSGLGSLSKRFESGSAGMSAIGYDRTGGTSYGSYQIASKVGSMENFLQMAEREAPDIAKKLRDAGPANTGSRSGGMPDMWRKLAQEEPERLGALQKQFIHETHYEPALNKIAANTNIDVNNISKAMQEVVFSTAVQHGPTGASRIFSRAADRAGNSNAENFEKKLIDHVYQIRSGQFGTSTAAVQSSVKNRMHHEKSLALNMLKSENLA